jgi:hypothetical protein
LYFRFESRDRAVEHIITVFRLKHLVIGIIRATHVEFGFDDQTGLVALRWSAFLEF